MMIEQQHIIRDPLYTFTSTEVGLIMALALAVVLFAFFIGVQSGKEEMEAENGKSNR